MFKSLIKICIALSLAACSTSPNNEKPTKFLKIGTGSKIEVLKLTDQFTYQGIPKGWVIEGLSPQQVLSPKTTLPFVQMTVRDAERGVFVQSAPDDFIVARYTKARLSVTPYLMWRWQVSEHRSKDHPVRLIVGFYGGKAGTPPARDEQFIWTGSGLPAYDRLLTIGFSDSGLRRGNIDMVGRIPHYIQRGGIVNTNQWLDEAADLENLYKRSWPKDQTANVYISFIGFMSPSKIDQAGITFSYVWLVR